MSTLLQAPDSAFVAEADEVPELHGPVGEQLAKNFEDASVRRTYYLARISADPRVLLGKPVIRGTRIPVELIARKVSEGATSTQLLEAYPQLTQEDILAVRG